MSNESLFIICTLANILFVLFSARGGRSWLFGSIAINFVLANIFGSKLITIFGLTIGAGNMFYASIFLATHFIFERYGKHEALKTIWYGVGFMVFFTIMAQGAVKFAGFSTDDVLSDAMITLFSFLPRVVLGSILAYIFAQYLNIVMYDWIGKMTRGKFLWLRTNGANIVSQCLDSAIFFSIAFFDLPGPILVQVIFAGVSIKVLVIAMGTPFLYIDNYFKQQHE